MATVQGADQHHEIVDMTTSKRPKVLMVVANPTTSTTTGWPVGFWAAELTHPYYEFTRVRYDVTVASPNGGKVEIDALSDPRDESKWSADDLISMGFLNTPELAALLEDTPGLAGWGSVSRFSALPSPASPPPDQEGVTLMQPISFEEHIKTMFRPRDRESMQFAFDLWSYDDVTAHADDILARVRAGTMPCDGAWPKEQVDALQSWIDAGKPR